MWCIGVRDARLLSGFQAREWAVRPRLWLGMICISNFGTIRLLATGSRDRANMTEIKIIITLLAVKVI